MPAVRLTKILRSCKLSAMSRHEPAPITTALTAPRCSCWTGDWNNVPTHQRVEACTRCSGFRPVYPDPAPFNAPKIHRAKVSEK